MRYAFAIFRVLSYIIASVSLAPTGYATPITLTPSQDIWTTSVFSYTGAGGGPGGGLNNDQLRVGGFGDQYNSLLQFDLSSAPAVASSATLRLYDTSANSGSPVSMFVDQVTSAWNWTTQAITALSPDNLRLWWANRPSATQISTVAAPTVGSYTDIDVTGLYNQWQSGAAPNFGVQLRPTGTSNQWNYFASSENATTAFRPQLIINEEAVGSPPPNTYTPIIPLPTTALPIASLLPPASLYNGIGSFLTANSTPQTLNGAFNNFLLDSIPISVANAYKTQARASVAAWDQKTKTGTIPEIELLAGLLAGGHTGLSVPTKELLVDVFPFFLQRSSLTERVPKYAAFATDFLPTIYASLGSRAGLVVAGTTFLTEWGTIPLMRSIANDPHDPNYQSVVTAIFPSYAPTLSSGNVALDQWLITLQDANSRAQGFLTALNASFDRYTSAYEAGDPLAAELQLSAMLQYMVLVRDEFARLRALWEQAPIFIAQLDFNPLADAGSFFAEIKNEFLQHGLPADLETRLLSSGFTDSDITLGIQQFLSADFTGTAGDVFALYGDLATSVFGFPDSTSVVEEPDTLMLILTMTFILSLFRRKSISPITYLRVSS